MQSEATASLIPIGIDLGSLYSCISVFQKNRVDTISKDSKHKLIPSYVAFTNTEQLTGDKAKSQRALNPRNTIFGIKSFIGRKFDDLKINQSVNKRSFKIVNDGGQPKIQVEWGGETINISPEDISAMLFTSLRKIAENHLETSVKDAVIAVPAYFNCIQRQVTKDAAEIAGLNVARIVSEPVATALAYRFFDENVNKQKMVLIFYLGGESTEVSIIDLSKESLEIKATAYDQCFGGIDFDNRLVKHLTNEFKRKFEIDLNLSSICKLQNVAEQAKQSLSSSIEVEIKIDNLVDDINFCTKVSRRKFEELCSDLFSKTLGPVKKALNDAKLDVSSIDDIVLVGGSTKIPKIQNLLMNFFPCKSFRNLPINPEETVACGAAILAAVISGVETIQHVSELCIQDGQFVSLDVTPFSLSTESTGGRISKIINRNTKIPCKQTCSFTTDTDNQHTITFKVYEGERAESSENNLLYMFELAGILPAPRGVPKIEVTFSINADGILKITAEENSSKISKTVVVQNNRREELFRTAVEEAERCKEEDSRIGLQEKRLKGTKRKISE